MSNSNNLFVKFKNMPVDSIIKTVIVATILCFVCSMVVSFAAVNLKEIQDVNNKGKQNARIIIDIPANGNSRTTRKRIRQDHAANH